MKGRKTKATIWLLVAVSLLTACGRQEIISWGETTAAVAETSEEMQKEEKTESAADIENTDVQLLSLNELPEEYMEENQQAGQVVRLNYETNTYDEENRYMEKYAYVYLPYGYDPDDEAVRYNVFYLMHGWTGDAELYLGGEPGNRPLKRILDNLIANGDMEPMIVVTPTYYQDNQERGGGVSREDAVLTAGFYNELQKDLIPAVEGRFHTFAQSVSEEDLKASRGHRIFGGFSMGAVTTWYTFLHCLDNFKYYMPISGDCWVISETHMGATEETADETAGYLNQYIQASEYSSEDFVIYALTGTDDTAYEALKRQIEAMKNYPKSFHYSDLPAEGNLFFQVAEDGIHDYSSMIQYIYNALPMFDRMISAE